MAPFGRLFFYSLYTNRILLKMVQLSAPGLLSIWGCSGKILNTMIYSPEHCWVKTKTTFLIPLTFHFFFNQLTKDYRKTSVISEPVYLFSLFFSHQSLPQPHMSHQTLLVLRLHVIPPISLEGSGKWCGLVARLIFHGCVAALTHRGQEHRGSID